MAFKFLKFSFLKRSPSVVTGKFDRASGKSRLAQVVLAVLGAQLLFFAAFTSFEVPSGNAGNLKNWASNVKKEGFNNLTFLPNSVRLHIAEQWPELIQPAKEVRYTRYTPLVPVCILIGYALGWMLGAIAVVLFLAVSFFGPLVGIYPLAAGGGMDYYSQPGFGYLIGLLFSAAATGYLTERKRSSLMQLAAMSVGLLAVHGMGLIYLVGTFVATSLLSGAHAAYQWQPWVFEQARNLSWLPLPYDLTFSLFAVGAGYPIAWLCSVLTKADLGAGREESVIQNQVRQTEGALS